MNVAELVVLHREWIQCKARRFCQDKFEAEDLASETIYKCLRNSDRFNPSKSFKPWVLTIMVNTYCTWFNRQQCVPMLPIVNEDMYSHYDTADQRTHLLTIIKTIRELSQRSCCIECVLLFAKGYAYEEIARIKSIPVTTVKSRIRDGRGMLREALLWPQCQ